VVPDLLSSRGESTTSEVGFYPGNMQEGQARETLLIKNLFSSGSAVTIVDHNEFV